MRKYDEVPMFFWYCSLMIELGLAVPSRRFAGIAASVLPKYGDGLVLSGLYAKYTGLTMPCSWASVRPAGSTPPTRPRYCQPMPFVPNPVNGPLPYGKTGAPLRFCSNPGVVTPQSDAEP